MKKIPQRTCVICHAKFDKRDLLRIVANNTGEVFFDPTSKANGRGAYLCESETCLDQFLTKNYLERVFKRKIDADVTQKIREEISKKKEI